MKIGDHPSLQPVYARSFLPVASGLFVLPNAGLPPAQLVGTSRHVAQVSAVERVQAKADLHDKLFAAREGIAQVAAGEVGDEAVSGAARTFNAYLDALDRGNSNDRKKGDELRAAVAGTRLLVRPAGVDVVAGKLVPDGSALSLAREAGPEAVSDAFTLLRDRLDPVFAAQSESIAVEAETAQARIPVAQSAAPIGATIAALALRGAGLTQMISRMGVGRKKQLTQAQKIQKLVTLTLPKPTVPGTVLPGFPALGKPVGIAGPQYQVNRVTPGVAPGQPTVSQARKGSVPAFQAPEPVELKDPAKSAGPPGQLAEVSQTVRAVDRRRSERPVGNQVRLPKSGDNLNLDRTGKPRPAKALPRPVPKPPPRVPGPEPRDDKRRKGVPELPEPAAESEPVTPRDQIPRNPGKPLKDLVPKNPLPTPPGNGGNRGN